ncbi:hypothetical protein D1AOALGA4SA_13026 [Olavius algarvensis Delta 1 endosymbiont]|nr:hypothetical protein D1AOALGA4SA_13026 [Olavius algarvensis Delta 1 endosymbiont]
MLTHSFVTTFSNNIPATHFFTFFIFGLIEVSLIIVILY